MFSRCCLPFSLNWVILSSSPMGVTQLKTHASSVCSGTWDCTNTVHRSGVSPQATRTRRRLDNPLRQHGHIVLNGDGVIIDHGKDALVTVDELRPVPDGADIVADVNFARRLDTAENPIHRLSPSHTESHSVFIHNFIKHPAGLFNNTGNFFYAACCLF